MPSYTPPTPNDLRRLKRQLCYSGEQMAALAKVSSGQQWRKYTSASEPRNLNFHILFFLSARLELEPSQLKVIYEKMQQIGAELNIEALNAIPQLQCNAKSQVLACTGEEVEP